MRIEVTTTDGMVWRSDPIDEREHAEIRAKVLPHLRSLEALWFLENGMEHWLNPEHIIAVTVVPEPQ